MKYLYLLLLTIALPAFGKPPVQIFSVDDANGIPQSYFVRSWTGPDEGMIDTPYTLAEAQQKFPSLFDKTLSGTSKMPKRITIIFNEDSTVNEIEFQSTGVFERSIKDVSQLSKSAVDECVTVKDDVQVKTGG